MKVKVTQSCPTLFDPMDYTVHGILNRTEYWSGQSFPSPGDIPNPGIKPRSSALQADSLPAEPLGQEDSLEKEMATHSSIFAWEIPWTEEHGGLQSMESQKSWT